MNIKDPEVHAMARELAGQRGTTVTDAVRQALKAELARSDAAGAAAASAKGARQQHLLALLDRYRELPWPRGISSEQLQAELYNAQGLPI